MHIFIYTKRKNNAKRFHKQKARHFAKIKTICVTFLYTKIRILYVTQFCMNFLKLAGGEGGRGVILICKKITLRYTFICKKMHFTLRFIYKKQTLCVTFLYAKKQWTLHYVLISKMYLIVLIPNYSRTYNQSNQIDKRI